MPSLAGYPAIKLLQATLQFFRGLQSYSPRQQFFSSDFCQLSRNWNSSLLFKLTSNYLLNFRCREKLEHDMVDSNCNSRLFKSHMRFKNIGSRVRDKSLVFFYLKRLKPIRFTCDMRLKPALQLKGHYQNTPPPPL